MRGRHGAVRRGGSQAGPHQAKLPGPWEVEGGVPTFWVHLQPTNAHGIGGGLVLTKAEAGFSFYCYYERVKHLSKKGEHVTGTHRRICSSVMCRVRSGTLQFCGRWQRVQQMFLQAFKPLQPLDRQVHQGCHIALAGRRKSENLTLQMPMPGASKSAVYPYTWSCFLPILRSSTAGSSMGRSSMVSMEAVCRSSCSLVRFSWLLKDTSASTCRGRV